MGDRNGAGRVGKVNMNSLNPFTKSGTGPPKGKARKGRNRPGREERLVSFYGTPRKLVHDWPVQPKSRLARGNLGGGVE